MKEVTCAEPYDWDVGGRELGTRLSAAVEREMRDAPLIVALDYGIKRNILHRLVCERLSRASVMPAAATAADILAPNPDGTFLSNGPADPAALPYASEAVRGVLGTQPIFGICLGHQILGLATRWADLQARLWPSRRESSGDGPPHAEGRDHFAEPRLRGGRDSLEGRAELSHLNLNDQTVEGLCGVGVPVFSVQYHPEASPGPHDADYLFARFRRLVEEFPRLGAEALDRTRRRRARRWLETRG